MSEWSESDIATDGHPSPAEFVPPKALRCRCSVGELAAKNQKLWQWATSMLYHGNATQQEVFDRIEHECPGLVKNVSRISYHDRHHVQWYRDNKPEYRLRQELMEKLTTMAASGGMGLAELLQILANVAGIVLAAQSVETFHGMDRLDLVKWASELADKADIAASRVVDREAKSLRTTKGQEKLFDAWREGYARELMTNPAAWDELKKAVEGAKR